MHKVPTGQFEQGNCCKVRMCGVAKFNEAVGSTNAGACIFCEAGKYAASEGAAHARNAPKNTSSDVGQTECKPCPDARETNTPDCRMCSGRILAQ